MHKEALDNIIKLGEKRFNDGYVKKVKNIIDRSFQNPDIDEVERIINETETTLGSCMAALPESHCNEHIIIEKLGCSKKKNNVNPREELHKAAENLSNVLAGYEEDITITLQHKNGDNNQTQLILSSQNGSASINGMLRGVFGQARVKSIAAEEIATFKKRVYAKIRIPYEKNKQEQQNKKITSWIDLLSSSFPVKGDFGVSVRIVPLEECSGFNLDERIKLLAQHNNDLSQYAEQDRSFSSSVSGNSNHEYSIVNALKNKLHDIAAGKEEVGVSYSGNRNYGYKLHNRYAKLLIEEIDDEIYRLKRAQETFGWATEIMVTANDDETLQTVTGIMSGALKPAMLEVSWSNKQGAALISGNKEILPMLLFPTKEFNGLTFTENEEFSLEAPVSKGREMKVGMIMQNSDKIAPFVLSENALNRHAFVCGMTGSGKTNTMFKIIEKLKIPFLIIEPVKGEYRSLTGIYDDIKVLTMKTGEVQSNVNIMQINPFWFPENSNIAFHIDSIKTIISSAFDLNSAMPNILEQCLYNIYVKSGWDLVSNKNIYKDSLPEEYLYPTFSDLCREVEEYLDNTEFGSELMGDYKGAMLSRLRSFVNGFKGVLLNTTKHPDYKEFMQGKIIIELEGLADDADKCLVMGTILVQYYQFLKLNFNDKEKTLKHLIVIEEAHRLFKNVKKKVKQDGPDMVGQLVDSLSNIMAEIRAFGEGFVIVDQSPTKIADDVIKNSATKIIHRIDDYEDIKILQSSLLIPEDRTSIPSLKQGEALIRSEGMIRPCKVNFELSDVKENYSLSNTFKPNSEVDKVIAIQFAATSVLSDQKTKQEIQEMIYALLKNFYKYSFEKWYDTIHAFLVSVILIMQEQKKYEVVDGRFQVVSNVILDVITDIQKNLTVKERGCINMFISRFLELYYRQKNDYKVKDLEIKLMDIYFRNNIQKITEKLSAE